ncbi:MAG TPA: sigma-70 family RNA polymerase sigma factor [Verrucomicrobiae bacterium]|nr:sigma-70 family RNA polymerase sigma factor [Verrucomicrobiae bacterium]
MSLTSEPTAGDAAFPATHWSAVLSSSGTSARSSAALEELCRVYWRPLYVFLRRKGNTPHDSQDLVQGFLERLLERKDLANVSPEKGRFRTYLLTSLRNFMIKQAEREKAAKRGGGKVLIPLDADEAERMSLPDLSAESPEAAYDRQWARTVLGRALDRLRSEHIARNKEALFEGLVPFLEGADPKEYEGAGQKLAMKTGTVAVAVHRMRGRLQELLRAEVLQTVGNSADADAELRELLEALARG